MLKSEAAAYLAGVTQTEGAEASAPTNLHVITGEVGEMSEDGKALVKIDGLMFSESDNQYIEIDALGGLEEGDIATLILSGEQGHAMTPLAIGSIGSIDRITVRIAAIEADYIKVQQLDAAEARIGELEADHVSVDDLDAATARIGTLETTRATITDLEAATARIHSLEVDHVTVDNFEAATARIGDLESDHVSTDDLEAATGRIGQLEADTADIDTIRANSAKVQNLTAAQLEADHATIGSLDTNYAHITNGVIDNAKIGYADVNNLSAHYAEIQNGHIDSALIDTAAIVDEQVFTVTGNKATISEINADNITVRNLHTSNLTVDTADGYVTIGNKQTPTKEFLDSLKDELQQEIDGAVETFTSSAVPLLNNYPASEWIVSGATAEEQRKAYAKHVGDICYVQNSALDQNGYAYRFAYDSTEQTFKWVLIKDSDVTKALGDISNLKTFESDTTTWMEETDEGLTTIRQNHTALSGVVDKTVVETKQLWFTKSNTTAPNKPTTQVTSTSTAGNAWRVVVPAYNASYPNYYYCLQYKLADGTYAWSDVVRDIAMGESQQQGRKGVADAATADGKAVAAQTTADGAATAAATADGKAVSAQTTANANIKSSVQLWFTKANTTAPNKPTAQVTVNDATKTNQWNLAIPTYNSSYPNYFYCYQQQKGDGTWQWTDVVYDRSITEAQAKAQASLPSSEFNTFKTTTFKEVVDEVGEHSTSISTLSETLSTKADSSTVTTLSNTVNTVKQTADTNKASITSLTQTVSDKADNSTVTTLTNRVSTVEQDVDGIEKSIGELQTTVSEKADSSTVTTVSNKLNTVSDTVDGHTQTLTSVQNTLSTKADSSTVSTLTTKVNNVSDTVDGHTQTISGQSTILSNNGLTSSTNITNRVSSVEQDLSGYKTTVSETYATQTALATTNGNVTAAQTAADNAQAAADKANGRQVAYSATSSTGASTAAKVAACTNFPALAAGATVTVRFSTANTSTGAVTLNVNSTGAKTVYVNGAATSSSNQLLWGANANITFTYDGSYWRVDSEPRTWYGTGAVAAATAAKTATINEVVICKGTTVVLNMTNENTSTSATLNVTSTGAKNIYYGTTTTRPTTSNGYGWSAGSTASLTFDGQYWRIGDTTALARLTAAESTISSHTTSISQNASAIALKADSSTTYTKTDVDGLISTEVTNRNAAITAKANEITSSVSETYATKTAVNGKADASDVTALAGRVTTAETNITQNAQNIALRATKTEVQQVRPAYASSSTAAGTAAKVATIDPAVTGYALYNGASVAVTFSTANTAATPTLNLNSTGAKQIRSYTGATLSEGEYKWAAGATIDLVYDGTYWRMQDGGSVKRVTAAEASIRVNADNIESKVSKDGVISSINQSAETVKIQASKVEIDGTAVFSAISSDVDDAITSKGYQTSSQVNSAITSKGYATTTQAQGYATTAKSEAISAAATDATTKANAAEANAKAYTDALEIGGRNLLLGTAAMKRGTGGWNTGTFRASGGTLSNVTTTDLPLPSVSGALRVANNGSSASNVGFAQDGISGLIAGEAYTESGWIRASAAMEGYFQPIWKSSWQVTVPSNNAAGKRFNLTTDWQWFSWTGTLNGEQVSTYSGGYVYAVSVPVGGWFEVCGLKLEKGNKATDWTPAPEDIAADIAAAQATANAAAPKANAVKRTQRIYYRTSAAKSSWTMPSAWLTTTTDVRDQWTCKVPRLTANADGTGTKYLYLYTCEQREMADGTIAYTTVLLDDSTTIIDGGNIITGSVTANAISATSGTFSTANIPALTADHIKANVISAVNNGTGTIDADKINVGAIKIGDLNGAGNYSTTTQMNSAISTAVKSVSQNWFATCTTAADTKDKVATITPATTDFSLKAGATVNVKFTNTNSYNATSSSHVTLNVNSTGAKNIYYGASSAPTGTNTTPFGRANYTNTYVYDGTYWVWVSSSADNNTTDIPRSRYEVNISAAEAVTNYHIICGTSSGYRNIAANVSFDLNYPLLYAGAAIAKGATTGTRNYNFTKIQAINFSTNGTITSGAASKMLYLKGTVDGKTFKISASPFMTTVVPTSDDGFAYIPLGYMSSATVGYFDSSTDVYAFRNGAFQKLDSVAKYITAITDSGIRVHAKTNPTTNYAAIDADGMDVVKGGVSVAQFGKSDEYGPSARIGQESKTHIVIDTVESEETTGDIDESDYWHVHDETSEIKLYGADGTRSNLRLYDNTRTEETKYDGGELTTSEYEAVGINFGENGNESTDNTGSSIGTSVMDDSARLEILTGNTYSTRGAYTDIEVARCWKSNPDNEDSVIISMNAFEGGHPPYMSMKTVSGLTSAEVTISADGHSGSVDVLADEVSLAGVGCYMDHGVVNSSQNTATPANGTKDFVVTFNHEYKSPPHVVPGFYSTSTAAGLGGLSCAVNSITTTGCTIRVFNNTSTTRFLGVEWIAIG